MKRKGVLFILSAPSGTGKTTLCNDVMNKLSDIRFSISYTTRSIRDGETDGVDYHFTDELKFRKMIESGDFAEWAEVHGGLYGTALKDLLKAETDGIDLVLDIDWQGARQMKSKVKNGVYIFILPPDLKELKRRLNKRGKDSDETIKKRLNNARGEMTHATEYDYTIVNDELDEAKAMLISIITTERHRRQ